MQDVCISFWKEDGSSDMMLKVTDVCSTDPSDPTYCESPADIKVDRSKVSIMEGLTANPLKSYEQLAGSAFPEKTWWFFMKCWADGLPQPAYQNTAENWFTTPALPNNLKWAQDTVTQQYKNNQAAYPAKGWETYPDGAYNTKRDDTTSPPISDWVAGQELAWSPIAGGKGWGNPSEQKGSGSGVMPHVSKKISSSAPLSMSTSSSVPVATSSLPVSASLLASSLSSASSSSSGSAFASASTGTISVVSSMTSSLSSYGVAASPITATVVCKFRPLCPLHILLRFHANSRYSL